jgi:recombination associated protein RdgC
MTTWVSDAQSRPANLQLGDKATLKAKGDDGKIAATQVDLDSDEIQQLLESGRQATNLAITIDERVSGVLTDTLQLKGLRFSDQLIEQADMTETKRPKP